MRRFRKRFSIKVGTIFADTKIPLRKWFMAIWLITSHKKGIASTQLAKDISVTQKTAWFMLIVAPCDPHPVLQPPARRRS